MRRLPVADRPTPALRACAPGRLREAAHDRHTRSGGHGAVPAVISATVLPRLTSRAAAELFLTGEVFDGTRAAQVGLVTAAVPATDLDARVDRYVGGLLRGAPGALAGAKALLRRTPPDDIGENLAELTGLSVSYFRSAEGLEGVAAYRQKRDPAWVVPD